MKVVSVVNYKGGVGKTTVTSNLAIHIAAKGKRVLMIDVDPQTNLTLSFIDNGTWEEQYAKKGKTLMSFFEPIFLGSEDRVSLESLIIPLIVEDIEVDIISSHLDLINVDTELAATLIGGNQLHLASNYLKAHNYFREEIGALKEKYDLILIDCGPSFNTVTKNALTASDLYLTPSKMDYLSTFGVLHLVRNIDNYVHTYNEYVKLIKHATKIAPEMLGVVATMVGIYDDALIKANQRYWDELESAGHRMFKSYLRENIAHYSMAPLNNIPVILSKGSHPTILELVSELKSLGEEFIMKAGI